MTAQVNDADRHGLSTRTRTRRTVSSSFLCRQSSSSYSRIVLSNSPNISSAAAVSRWLTKSLTLWTLDIVVQVRTAFPSDAKLSCGIRTLKHADQAKLTLTCQQRGQERIGMAILKGRDECGFICTSNWFTGEGLMAFRICAGEFLLRGMSASFFFCDAAAEVTWFGGAFTDHRNR